MHTIRFDGRILFYGFTNFSKRSHTALWKNEKITLTKIFFRQINSLVIYLVNALLSRNFRQKSVRVNFRNFHTVHTAKEWETKVL